MISPGSAIIGLCAGCARFGCALRRTIGGVSRAVGGVRGTLGGLRGGPAGFVVGVIGWRGGLLLLVVAFGGGRGVPRCVGGTVGCLSGALRGLGGAVGRFSDSVGGFSVARAGGERERGDECDEREQRDWADASDGVDHGGAPESPASSNGTIMTLDGILCK